MIKRTKIINKPKIVNHFDPCLFINSENKSPNLYDRYEIIKNLKLLEIKLTITKTNKLKPINPLAIVNALYGKGVKPAKKRILNQARKPSP